MNQEALSYFTDIWLTLIALIIFFSFFVVMSFYVMRVRGDHIKKMSHLPLEENQP